MKTILVQIASYRDWELINTIHSALSSAEYPDRLRFAIVMQDEPSNYGSLDEFAGDARFKIDFQHWRDARGVGVARNRTDQMYGGEDFFLQTDSHMRFIDKWDSILIEEWESIGDSRAVLSSYPPAYKYNDDGIEEYVVSNPNRLVVHDTYMNDIPVFFGYAIPNPRIGIRASFVAGGMQFGPGSVCIDVPYESRISFIGEEVIHSLRLFASGYNAYSIINQVAYHLYLRSKNQPESHHFWTDFLSDEELKTVYQDMNNSSYQTVMNYFNGFEGVSSEVVHIFENFSGVDFKRRRVHKDTYGIPLLPMALDDLWRGESIEFKKQN